MAINNNLLFGLDPSESEEDLYLSGKLFFKTVDLSNITNSPCLVDRKHWESSNKSDVRVVFPFPRSRDYAINDLATYPKDCIKIVNKLPFFLNNRIKTIENFDYSRVKNLQSYVDVNEVITFNIWNCAKTAYGYCPAKTEATTCQSITSFIENMPKGLIERYKYSSVEYLKLDEGYVSNKPGDLLCFVTFISLPNCIPMFNYKKMSGMGLILRFVKKEVTLKKGRIVPACQMALLFTNHLENKFVVDGVTICTPRPIAYSRLGQIAKFVKTASKFKDEDKVKDVEAKRQPSKAEIVLEVPSSYGNATATTTNGTTFFTYT